MFTTDQIQAIADRIAERFHPEKIVLFGSYAYGTPTEDSDIDLLVVMPYAEDWTEAIRKVKRAIDDLRDRRPIDILVKAPEEVAWRYEGYDPIIRRALDDGQLLYAA